MSVSEIVNKVWNYAWAKLNKLDGDDLELQYCHTLENLGKKGVMLGILFRKAHVNRINTWKDPKRGL